MKAEQRVLSILDYLASIGKPCQVTEISRQLKISKSTTSRNLSSLKSGQWVAQDTESRRYTIGTRALEFSLSILSCFDIRQDSLSYLGQLRDATGETSMLSLRAGLERMYIEQVPGVHEVRQIVQLGKPLPLWCGAPGKAILAYMEESDRQWIVDTLRKSGVVVLASGQTMDIDRLQEELAEIRKQGFALSVGERVAGTSAVAAPIIDRQGQVAGAISVSGPLSRFSVDLATHYGPLVREAARAISRNWVMQKK